MRVFSSRLQPYAIAAVGLLMLAATADAQVPLHGNSLYDSFADRLLDPHKWSPSDNHCYGRTLECIREITAGHLRLAVRNVGATDRNSGIEWSQSYLPFPEAVSAAVSSIRAEVVVRRYEGVGCPANPDDLTHTEVAIGGNFFNSGIGDPGDDVGGWLIIWIDTSDPTTMEVGNWWGWGESHGWQGYWTPVASYPVGTPLVVSYTWDPQGQQFVATVREKGDLGGGTRVAASYGDYGVSDALPAASVLKYLRASAHTLNCEDTLTVNHVDTLFDNVAVR